MGHPPFCSCSRSCLQRTLKRLVLRMSGLQIGDPLLERTVRKLIQRVGEIGQHPAGFPVRIHGDGRDATDGDVVRKGKERAVGFGL